MSCVLTHWLNGCGGGGGAGKEEGVVVRRRVGGWGPAAVAGSMICQDDDMTMGEARLVRKTRVSEDVCVCVTASFV